MTIEASAERPLRLIMTAAHGGSNSEKVPLGGGAAICERLCRCWASDPRLDVTLMAPGATPPPGVKYHRLKVLGERSPATLNELAYAKFCRDFEQQLTAEIISQRPDVVLTHDLSEGPNYAMLERYGIPCIPIYHVDVVDFFCRMYLHKLVSPRRAEALWRHLRPYPLVPDVLRLVFDKQADTVKFCPRIIVPSSAMRTVLEETYPDLRPQQVEVVPWGSPEINYSPAEIDNALAKLKQQYNVRPGDKVIVTLSRISAEKGQDLLLQGLLDSELTGPMPQNCVLFICGKGAYMGGERFYAKLQRLASKLRGVRVIFPGHLGGADKVAMLRLADVFVSASRHESYGLTTMEAMLQRTAIVAVDTAGTRETVTPECAIVVPRDKSIPAHLVAAIRSLLADDSKRQLLAENAQQRAQSITFKQAAERIYEILDTCRRK